MLRRSVLLFMAAACCLGAKKTPTPSPTPKVKPPASIGSATMDENGTIFLRLRAEDGNGSVGEGFFSYPKGHKEYDEILKHVGGLKPGESKPCPPWPEKQ